MKGLSPILTLVKNITGCKPPNSFSSPCTSRTYCHHF